MTMSKQERDELKLNAARRGNYRRELVLKWVRNYRPDVFATATEEAYKKFPRAKYSVSRGHSNSLPESLKKLK